MSGNNRKDFNADGVQLIEGEPGHETKLNLHYTRKYKAGNTTGFIVAPQITREENGHHWAHVNEIASSVMKRMVERDSFNQRAKLEESKEAGNV